MSTSRPLWAQFNEVAGAFADKKAVVDAANGESLSYKSLQDKALAMSGAIEASGFRALVIIGEPPIQGVPLSLACAAADVACVPVSQNETEESLLALLRHLPERVLVVSWRSISVLAAYPVTKALQIEGGYWYKGPEDFRQRSDALRPFLVTHSSGSTGSPKPVAISQEKKLVRTRQSISLFKVGPDDSVLSVSPFHHSLGQRHFFLALLTGATLIKAYPFTIDGWIGAVQRYAPTVTIPVATHLKMLQTHILKKNALLQGFRVLVTSSAPAEAEFKARILDQAKFEFWEIYGMTETACATSVRYVPGSSTGHLGTPIRGSAIRVRRPDDGGVGEIEVHNDCMCEGYWGDPERWQASLTPDGFFKSGDLGRFDDDGNLIYVGRANESFQSSGLVVYPGSIEKVVLQIPGVFDCVAFGAPDTLFENLVALVYSAEPHISQTVLAEECRKRLPKNLWPARIKKVSSFPQLPSGKVDRRGAVGLLN